MNKKKLVIAVVVSVVLVISITFNIISFVNKNSSSELAKEIDKNSYQAVFMVGGNSWAGKLSVVDDNNYKLTNVYYSADDSGKLTKLGNEDHKPQNSMIISRENILLWENLQNAGQWDNVLNNK